MCPLCTNVCRCVDNVIQVPSAQKAPCLPLGWAVLTPVAPPHSAGAIPTAHSRLLGDVAWESLLLSFHLIYSYLPFTSLLKHYWSEEEASLGVPITSQARSGGGVFSLMPAAFLHLIIHSSHFFPASSLPEGPQRQACSLWPPHPQHRDCADTGTPQDTCSRKGPLPRPPAHPGPLRTGTPLPVGGPVVAIVGEEVEVQLPEDVEGDAAVGGRHVVVGLPEHGVEAVQGHVLTEQPVREPVDLQQPLQLLPERAHGC